MATYIRFVVTFLELRRIGAAPRYDGFRSDILDGVFRAQSRKREAAIKEGNFLREEDIVVVVVTTSIGGSNQQNISETSPRLLSDCVHRGRSESATQSSATTARDIRDTRGIVERNGWIREFEGCVDQDAVVAVGALVDG